MKLSKTLQILAVTTFIGSIAQAQDAPIQDEAAPTQFAQPEPPNAPAAPEQSLAPVAPKFASETFEAMMGGVEDNNRASFIAFGDAGFKAAITPTVFQNVANQVTPRLQGEHAFKYLEQMNRGGLVTYLWRVRFEDGGDDILAMMTIKDGKVAGFLLI